MPYLGILGTTETAEGANAGWVNAASVTQNAECGCSQASHWMRMRSGRGIGCLGVIYSPMSVADWMGWGLARWPGEGVGSAPTGVVRGGDASGVGASQGWGQRCPLTGEAVAHSGAYRTEETDSAMESHCSLPATSSTTCYSPLDECPPPPLPPSRTGYAR